MLLNGNQSDKTIKIPAGKWTLAGDGNTINEKELSKLQIHKLHYLQQLLTYCISYKLVIILNFIILRFILYKRVC